MARKELFIKSGVTYYADPKTVSKDEKNKSWLRKILVKLLSEMGVPVVDPCCEPGDRVPLAFNRTTGQDEVFVNGQWVPVESATGSTITSTTTTEAV